MAGIERTAAGKNRRDSPASRAERSGGLNGVYFDLHAETTSYLWTHNRWDSYNLNVWDSAGPVKRTY